LAQIARIGFSTLGSMFVIRYLGPTQYGTLAFVSATVTLFSALVSLPQHGLIVRELANVGENDRSSAISSAFALRLIGAPLLIICSLIAVIVLGHTGSIVLFTLFAATAYLASPFQTIRSELEFDSKFGIVSSIDFFTSAASTGVKLLLIFFNAPLIGFAAITLFDAALQILIYLSLKSDKTKILNIKKIRKSTTVEYFKSGIPLILSGIAIAIFTRTDVIFITKMLDETHAGIYSAGIRVVEATFFLPSIIMSVSFPKIARLYYQDKKKYETEISKYILAITLIGIFVSTVVSASSWYVIPLLLGDTYVAATKIINITIWSIIIVGLNSAINTILTLERATKVSFYMSIIGAVTNILLNYILIPIYGISGAAIATIVAQVSGLLFLPLLYQKHNIFSMMAKPLYPGFIINEIILPLTKGEQKK
jgi:O-antigen/teichoic acid export membrane protein